MKTSLFLFSLIVAGCATAHPTTLPLPRELAGECSSNCEKLDMRMSAVVIIINSAGCVCEPKTTTASPPTAGSATVAAGAAIQAVLEAQRQSESTQRNSSSSN